MTGNFWVVAAISNPIRYKSRYLLYRKFEAEMKQAGANLLTVECAFGERPFSVTDSGNPNHIQLRTSTEIWHKENLLNIGVSRLPSDWKYVAWVDADVSFVRPDWVLETVQQLQHHSLVQMFTTAINLGPDGQALDTFNGFGYSLANDLPKAITSSSYYYGKTQSGKFWHPGFAWAARREAFEDLGGLLDFAILGAGDHHMALSCMCEGKMAVPRGLHPNYMKHVLQWQDRAERHVRRNVGFVPGTLLHGWHGKKVDRKYWERWSILKRHNYNPEADIKRDSQGLWTFSDQGLRMRHDIQRYFRGRNEDSIDL